MMFADLKPDFETELRRHGKEGRSNTNAAYRNRSNLLRIPFPQPRTFSWTLTEQTEQNLCNIHVSDGQMVYRIFTSGESKGSAPPAQNFLNFMQFFGIFGKIICWCPAPLRRGVAPSYSESWIRPCLPAVFESVYSWQHCRG